MKLTKSWLKATAGTTIYSRGKNYYDMDMVKNLTKKGTTYQADIFGTRNYTIKYKIEGNAIRSNCNCPYSAFCKHEVAVGIAIINNDYISLPNSTLYELSINDFMENIYHKTTTEQKVSFLKKLLTDDSQLRESFMHYCKIQIKKPVNNSNTDSSPTTTDTTNNAASQYDIVIVEPEDLSNLSYSELLRLFTAIVEPFMLELVEIYNNVSDKKIYKYEDYYDNQNDYGWAQEVTDINNNIIITISEYAEQIEQQIQQGKLLRALQITMAIIESIDIQAWIPTTNFLFNELIGSLIEQKSMLFNTFTMQLPPLNHTQISELLNFILSRLVALHNQDNTTLEYRIFHQFLSQQLNRDTAQLTHNFIEKSGWKLYQINTKLLVKVANLSGKNELLVKALKQTINQQEEVQRLFEYLVETEQQKILLQLAKIYLKDANNYQPSTFLLNYITQDTDLDFYKQLLKISITKYGNVLNYRIYRKFISPQELEEFIESLKINPYFYLQVLIYEKKYDSAKQILRKKPYYGQIPILQQIYDIMPELCFNIYKQRVEELIARRGRKNYQTATTILKEMHNIPTKLDDTKRLCRLYFSYKLNALKDEIRKAKLI